jgi:hypothetical protein
MVKLLFLINMNRKVAKRIRPRLIHRSNELKFDDLNKEEVFYLDKSVKEFNDIINGKIRFTSSGVVPETINYKVRYINEREGEEDFVYKTIKNIHSDKYKVDGWDISFDKQLDNKLAYSLSVSIVPNITCNFYLYIDVIPA